MAGGALTSAPLPLVPLSPVLAGVVWLGMEAAKESPVGRVDSDIARGRLGCRKKNNKLRIGVKKSAII